MDIAGFQKNSFVDYPGKIAAVVFCGGCNFNCWYCHNRHILHGYAVIDENEVFGFLEKRRGQIDAVVFSGGEATLQRDLCEKMKRVKDMGYLVKLDTNGSGPKALASVLSQGLADYIAMDVKAPFDKYKSVTGTDIDVAAVKKSIGLLMNKPAENNFEYEFRTTCIPQFTPADIQNIAREIAGARLYALQQYRHADTEYKISAIKFAPHEKEFFTEAKKLAQKYVGNVVIRGLQIENGPNR